MPLLYSLSRLSLVACAMSPCRPAGTKQVSNSVMPFGQQAIARDNIYYSALTGADRQPLKGSRAATACGPSSGKSRRRCDAECTGQFLKPGNGWRRPSPDISPITPYRPMARRLLHFATTSSSSGTGNYAGAARGHDWYGRRWRSWRTSSFPSRVSCTLGPVCGLPSDTRGRSRVPELGSLGSVRGAPSNERPYREHNGRS